MGAYVYALQPPATVREVELDGKPVALGNISFAYKPQGQHLSPSREAAKANARLDRELVAPLRRAWREHVGARPKFVTIDSTGVYTWPARWITCVDDVSFGVEVKKIGTLVGNRIERSES